MYKKVIVLISCLIFLILLGITIVPDEHEIITSGDSLIKLNNKSLTMMYETGYDSGEYQVSSDTIWPQEGYVFNAELSKCENGSILTWDEENKKVLLQANTSDKCFVYFDALLVEYKITSIDAGNVGHGYIYIRNYVFNNDFAVDSFYCSFDESNFNKHDDLLDDATYVCFGPSSVGEHTFCLYAQDINGNVTNTYCDTYNCSNRLCNSQDSN